jgi:hypothetical protein
MHRYNVGAKEYYEGLERIEHPPERNYDFRRSRAICERSMGKLIDGFQLAGQRVLSIGPNFGHEEYWFYRAGCPLVFADLDEHGLIAPYLQSLPIVSNPTLTYLIGDARGLSRLALPPPEVLYISGFSPDEGHRFEVRRRTLGRLGYLGYQIGYRLRGREELYGPRFSPRFRWPADQAPLSPLMCDLLTLYAPREGLTFLQMYAGGVLGDDETYLRALSRQLGGMGLTLRHVYMLRKFRNVHLAVIGREVRAANLGMIHARAAQDEPDQGVELVFSG